MNVLVTGADGFIGRALVARFLDEGWSVVAQVRRGSNHDVDARVARVVELDLAEFSALAGIAVQVELVVHLAWAGVGPEARNASDKQLPNLGAGLEIVDAATALGAKRILCPGSMAEFALHVGPVNGSEAPSPVDLYSATKVAARMLMGVRCAQREVGLVWALITSVYGPGRRDSNVLTYAIQELIAGRTPEFTGLEQIWDYIYVDDLVEALYRLALLGDGGRCYPVGSGDARPLASYIREVRDLIDPTAELRIGSLPYKSTGLDSSIPDISALCRDTGFVARARFSDGISETIRDLHPEWATP